MGIKIENKFVHSTSAEIVIAAIQYNVPELLQHKFPFIPLEKLLDLINEAKDILQNTAFENLTPQLKSYIYRPFQEENQRHKKIIKRVVRWREIEDRKEFPSHPLLKLNPLAIKIALKVIISQHTPQSFQSFYKITKEHPFLLMTFLFGTFCSAPYFLIPVFTNPRVIDTTPWFIALPEIICCIGPGPYALITLLLIKRRNSKDEKWFKKSEDLG